MELNALENIPDPNPVPLYDIIDGIPPADQTDRETILVELFALLDASSPRLANNLAGRLDASFRRYVALLWIIKPRMLSNAKQEAIAQSLGISLARFSQIVNEIRERFPELRDAKQRKKRSDSTAAPIMSREEKRAATVLFLSDHLEKVIVRKRAGRWRVLDKETRSELGECRSRFGAIKKAAISYHQTREENQ